MKTSVLIDVPVKVAEKLAMKEKLTKEIGDGLSLDALIGIDHQLATFAGLQGTGDLVTEIDVTGSVDQVEPIRLAVAVQVIE